MDYIKSNIEIVTKYIKIIHHFVKVVGSAEIRKNKEIESSQECLFDFFVSKLNDNDFLSKSYNNNNDDITFRFLAFIYYDLFYGKANCTRLSYLLFNLLYTDKNFKYKSNLKFWFNQRLNHCVLYFEDLKNPLVFDPWFFYFDEKRTDLLISTKEYYLSEINKIESFENAYFDWSFCNRDYFIKNIKFPIIKSNDGVFFSINHSEIQDYLKEYEKEYGFLIEKFCNVVKILNDKKTAPSLGFLTT